MEHYPLLAGVVTAIVLCLTVQIGIFCAGKLRPVGEEERRDLGIVTNSSLTFLALIIGFSYSMAVNRYDMRKDCEKEEASAISTAYIRADLLPAADAQKLRALLREYANQRLQYYGTSNWQGRDELARETEKLAAEMWSIVLPAAKAEPTPPMALVLSGVNEVQNTLSYTQAAWWNRIPSGAWNLIIAFAVFCCLLLGYGARHKPSLVFMVFPIVVAFAIFMIAELDTPGRGIIRVVPHNLISLSQSLGAQ